MNDHELLNQFLTQNSQPAFRALVERHTNWLYSVCLRRLRDPSLAEDATQAVFLALAQKASSLRHEKTLSPWLHQVAKFIAANILRAKARRTHHESEAAAMTPTITPAPDWSKIESHLEPALDRLPFADRQILLLRFYEQKSHPQIASLLSISEPAAAKRLSRALDRLRQILSPKSQALSSTALTSLLLSHSVTLAPAHLAAAAAISTTTATLAKGALTAMALAKLQTAALVIAACLLIAIPATMIALKHNTTPLPAPLADTTAAPASLDAFTQTYGLEPGQLFKLVHDAPPEVRDPFIREKFSTSPRDPASIFIGWNDNIPATYSYRGGRGYPLTQIISDGFSINGFELESSFPHANLTGDFVYRLGAAPADQCAAMQKFLKLELNINATLQFRDVPRKVIVLRGQWQYTPPTTDHLRNPPTGPDGAPLPSIFLYSTAAFEKTQLAQTSSGSASDPRDLANGIAWWLNQQVIIEAQNLPSSVGYRGFSIRSKDDTLTPQDKIAALKHLTEQTNLTWSEETRTVRRLFIESPK